MRKLVLATLWLASPFSVWGEEPLSLELAWQRVALGRQLQAAACTVEIKRGEAIQAALWINPLFEIDFDNIGGRNSFKGWQSAESTCTITQLIETGGRRGARLAAAAAEVAVAEREYERLAAALYRELQLAMAAVGVAQKKVDLIQDHLTTLHRYTTQLESFAEQGKVTALHCRRASMLLRQGELAALACSEELQRARLALAALWGCHETDFGYVAFALEDLSPLPPLSTLEPLLTASPEQELANAAVRTASAVVRRERTEWYPIVAVNAGWRTFYETKDHAYTIGLAVPLPLFHRNQGQIYSANAALCRTELERERLAAEQTSSLSLAYRQGESALKRAILYHQSLLPECSSTLSCTAEAYQNGKASYLETLEAQQTLFENQLAYLDALFDYHRSKITVTGLTSGLPDGCL